MPERGVALEKLGFLTIGLFDGQDPGPGHQYTLEMIELAERLGFDSAWLRCRHLQYGISSPVAVLAAASQRTARIELGTAVIPLGWENPLRLAEDLATVDVLSGGRINPGFSVGEPMHWADVREALYPDTADAEDFSYERAARLLRFVAGDRAATFAGHRGIRAVLFAGGAALPRAAGADVVRRRVAGVGPVGRPERGQLPDVIGGAGGRVGGLRVGAAVPHPGVPRGAPGRGGGAGVAGTGRDPDRQRVGRAARQVRGVRRGAHAAHRRAGRAGQDDVRAGHHRHVGPDR